MHLFGMTLIVLPSSTRHWGSRLPHHTDFPHPTHWMAPCTMTPTSTQRWGEDAWVLQTITVSAAFWTRGQSDVLWGVSVAELAFWLSQGLPERSRLWVTLCWHCCVLAQDSPMFTWDSYHFWIGPLLLPTHGPRATFWGTLTILGNSYTLK